MSPGDGVPRLSVIVVSFNGPVLLERCLSSLEHQSYQEGVEVLVVGRSDVGSDDSEELKRRFPRIQWIRAPSGYNVPQMRRLGIARSRGEIIALLEDDCVATETWCAALLKAHQEPHAAIGGAVAPDNYRKALDWAVYFCEYGDFMPPLPKGDARVLPGTNVSYKRTALTRLLGEDGAGDEIAPEGFYEVFVHRALQEAGAPLKGDPALVVRNVNSWRPSDALRSRFHHGRGFAAMRVAGRSAWRRLLFLTISIALPFVKVGRVVKEVIARRRYAWRLGHALPWVILFSISWSVGEFVGYLLGPGASLDQWR